MPSTDTDRHNLNVLHTLSKGDLVQFPRGTYSHWGIYAGNRRIIHHVAEEEKNSLVNGVSSQLNHCTGVLSVSGRGHTMAGGSGKTTGEVINEDFFLVAGNSKALKNNQLDREWRVLAPDVIVERAMSKIGKTEYDLFNNNCEHFATWCRYGVAISLQAINGAKVVNTADSTTTVVGVIAGVAAVAAGIGLTLLKLL